MRKSRHDDYIKPSKEIERIKNWVKDSYNILNTIQNIPDTKQKQLKKELKEILKISSGKKIRCYIVVNEGIHPVVEDLKKQYGDQIRYEVVTRGNVDLNDERKIVSRVKEILKKHHGAEFVIVPSGLPYLITMVYNTVLQITSKHPIYLQLDREKGRYVEKVLDPRKLML